jgi:tetratricopeptide (TPR) repeat protein
MDNLETKLDEASRYLSSRLFDDAVASCAQILDAIPGQPEASHVQAFALLAQSQTFSLRAIEQLKKGLELNPENPLLLVTLGEAYLVTGKLSEAREVLQRVVDSAPDYYYGQLVMGRVLLQYERYSEAETVLRKALSLPDADHLRTYLELARAVMPGPRYLDLLANFHAWLQPAAYVEIGVEAGRTLVIAQPPTSAVGIDPEPDIKFPLPETTQVFSLGSDQFFEQHHLPDVIGHATIDFAFIDGLHVFDQALRDFMNVEKYSHPNTVVVIHDCLPLDSASSNPNRTTNFWSGDPWKVMAVLRKFRPDLTCFTLPTSPTGLGVVTNLNAGNRVLHESYDEIIASYQEKDYDWLVDEGLEETLGVFVNDWDQIVARIGEVHAKRYE